MPGGRYRNHWAFGSSFLSRQNLQALFEAVLLESLSPPPVVKRIVRVQPVAFRVYFEVRDLGNFVVFDEELPFGNQRGNQADFRLVQRILVSVQLALHVRIGYEKLGG